MLTELRVRDLGVVDDLTIELGPGMTALTGETGAGKTLLVEALQLVLGERASAGLVRAGSAEALVEARFTTDDGEILLARAVPASGRSRAWVDGRMAPVAVLAEVGDGLVEIHGQHDQQSLLSTAAQRRALDEFAGADRRPLERARRELTAVEARLADLGGDEQQRAREADVLRHQLDEIDRARLAGPDEDDALRAEEERLADLGAHREAAAEALVQLDGADGAGGAGLLLGAAIAALAGRQPFAADEGRLRATAAEIADLATDLRTAVETWNDDPARLADVQSRRQLLADLRRKYGPTLADVLDYRDQAGRQLADLEGAAAAAEILEGERQQAREAVVAAENELRRARQAAAPALADAAGERLRTLAMPDARFDVTVGDDGPGDDVRFLLGANRGEPTQPLARVASGGELARTMLFDEVDAGVGGAAAVALGAALREVASGRQVLVVTHLAQVAAFADRQVAVHKGAQGGRTVTTATVLDRDERVVELSRMLSGHPDSAAARAHAEELLSTTAAVRTE